jgi:carboxyl-terminal processing protease
MIRKASFVLLGAVGGVAATLLVTQPRVVFLGSTAKATAAEDTYQQLNRFGDVFERVREDYVDKPDDDCRRRLLPGSHSRPGSHVDCR